MSDLALITLELCILPVLITPLGLAALALVERWVVGALPLTAFERLLIGFYGAGGLLFALSYGPGELFRTAAIPYVLASLSVLGWTWGLLRVLSSRRGVQANQPSPTASAVWPRISLEPSHAIRYLACPSLFLFVLLFEVLLLGGQTFPNTFDGSRQTAYVSILLSQGHAAWSLSPIASEPVAYPQGTSVWLATAAGLFHWPVVSSPLLLSPLFMALSVPAAFAWGERCFGVGESRGMVAGLVSACVTALLASWPRFLVGGYYDFLFALPAFMVALGLIGAKPLDFGEGWRHALACGLGLGVIGTLSPVPVEFLFSLILVRVLTSRPRSIRDLERVVRRLIIILIPVLALALPSLAQLAISWGYPGHGLEPIPGGSSFAIAASNNPWGALVGLVDPFLISTSFTWLSPLPLSKASLAILVAAGLMVLVTQAIPGGLSIFSSLPRSVARELVLAVGVGISLVSLVTILPASIPQLSALGDVSSALELSILLFVIYDLVAAVMVHILAEGAIASAQRTMGLNHGRDSPMVTPQQLRTIGMRRRRSPARPLQSLRTQLSGAALAVACVLPMVVGAAETVLEAPELLQENIIGPLSHPTSADIAALEFAGRSLPACSGVLVAPGSIGEFLPAYNPHLRVIYPVDPRPATPLYEATIYELTHGVYTTSVKANMIALGVTDVLVTGMDNVEWEPLQPAPMTASGDFTQIYPLQGSNTSAQSDALVLQFNPGASAASCSITP